MEHDTGRPRQLFRGREDLEPVLACLLPTAEKIEAFAREHPGGYGFCRGCGRWTLFRVDPPADGDWINLMESMLCECGLNGRMRGILTAVDRWLALGLPANHAAVFERATPLFAPLLSRLPGLVGSEFLGADCLPGEQRDAFGLSIRHESLLGTSYASDSLDLVMHFDVLEHVPDPSAALRECHRILRPGGSLLFSCPFYEALDRSVVRAVFEDGELRDLLAPCYHGNPVDGAGALVYTEFGWDLPGMVERAGFEAPGLWLMFDPVEGVLSDACPFPDGHAWPIVFVASKS